jgi:hypothetical protein
MLLGFIKDRYLYPFFNVFINDIFLFYFINRDIFLAMRIT